MDRVSVSRFRQVTTTITRIKEYITALSKLELDPTEYALVKAIAIFGFDLEDFVYTYSTYKARLIKNDQFAKAGKFILLQL